MAVADVLAQLVGASWRGVPFPCTKFSRSFSQDQSEHKWPDRDGGHVEATGRNLMMFKFSIPFRNGVAPGKNEGFGGLTLYPDQYQRFEAAFLDRSSGVLIHPELGAVTVKPREWSSDVAAEHRDGADVECTFIESEDDEDTLSKLVQSESALSTAVTSAADLDTLLFEFNVAQQNQPLPAPGVSFSDMMRSVQAAIDTPTLLSKQIGGQIDQISASLNGVTEALQRADSTLLWPIVQAVNNLTGAVIDLRTQLLTSGNPIRQLRATVTTLAALTVATGNTIEELIKLNPLLAEEVSIDAGTAVRYYLKFN